MRILFICIAVAVTLSPGPSWAQDSTATWQARIDSLNVVRQTIEKDLQQIDTALSELLAKIGRAKLEGIPSVRIETKLISVRRLWSAPILSDAYSIGEIPAGETVVITDYVNGYFEAKIKGFKIGYISWKAVQMNPQLEALKQVGDEETRIKKIQFEQDRIASKQARQDSLLSKYTPDEVEKINNKEVWIDMTVDQLIESWGSPSDINSTETATSYTSQWIYGEVPNVKYLYFVNGRLTVIQK